MIKKLKNKEILSLSLSRFFFLLSSTSPRRHCLPLFLPLISHLQLHLLHSSCSPSLLRISVCMRKGRGRKKTLLPPSFSDPPLPPPPHGRKFVPPPFSFLSLPDLSLVVLHAHAWAHEGKKVFLPLSSYPLSLSLVLSRAHACAREGEKVFLPLSSYHLSLLDLSLIFSRARACASEE